MQLPPLHRLLRRQLLRLGRFEHKLPPGDGWGQTPYSHHPW
jgi:hypothetical protein